ADRITRVHGGRAMARERHRHRARHPSAFQIADNGPSQVVHEESRILRLAARSPPRLPHLFIVDRAPVTVKYMSRGVLLTAREVRLQKRLQRRVVAEWELAPL